MQEEHEGAGTQPGGGDTVIAEHDVEARMSDGTILRADIYRPADGGPYPTLVCRTPYNKRWQRFVDDSIAMADHGYIAVVQDVRGRYTSDGDFAWQFRDRDETPEASDGYDTVEWAARLPDATGDVGVWGHSYDGWNGWMAASGRPPSLKALVASGISQNLHDMTPGIFETGRRLLWSYKMASDMRRREGRVDGPHTPDEAVEIWDYVFRGKYLWRLPIGDIPESVFGGLYEQFQTYLRSQDVEFWHLGDLHSEVDVPVLQITGWWDRLIGAADNYTGLAANGQQATRDQHRLVIGPWGHDVTGFTEAAGPVDYGPAGKVRYVDMMIPWFDHFLKGVGTPFGSEEPVQLFVLGENRWRGEKTWPLERTEDAVYFLESHDGANTLEGDGRLTQGEPPAEGSDTFTYDPSDPVMSLMAPDFQAAPVDQAPRDRRSDILVYETDPFESDTEFTGPVVLNLWASTDGPDTDWAATLAIVDTEGFAINLTYGIVRARYRDGIESPSLLEPGVPYEYRIELNPIGIVCKPGERLRLYVTSSDFPNFDRNHNTGADFWEDSTLRTAKQKVFHGSPRPSNLVLPLVPGDAG